MALSIGTASLKLVANADALTGVLDGAYASVQGFRKKAEAAAKSLSLAPLTSSIPLIGGPLTAAFAAVTGGAKLFGDAVARTKELSDIGRQAKSIGVAADQFMGLSAAAKGAGIEQDQFSKLLLKGSATIASGSAAAVKGLAAIGLKLSDVQGLSADQQFYKIADGLKGVTDSGTKALVAQELFGKGAYDLLPVLAKGGDGLKSFVAQQKAMGTALSDKDMAAVERARSAMPKIQGVFDGLFNKVVVAMAPLIETVGTVFSKIVGKLQPVFDWIARAAEAYFGVIGPIVEEVIDAVSEGIGSVADLFGGIFDNAAQMPTIGEVITGTVWAVVKAYAYALDGVKAFGGAVGVVASYAVDAFGSVVKVIGDVIAIAAELPENLGGGMFKDAAAAVTRFGERSKAAADDMRAWGGRQVDAFGSNAAQVDAWFEKLQAKKTVELEVKPFVQKIPPVKLTVTATVTEKYLGAAALEEGSKEAYAVRAKWDFGTTKLATAQEKANQILGDIKTGIDGVTQAIESIPALPAI
ncbi:hypothetical protein [Limnoglobus roseus]|uniref:Phage tail tape measure protein n=1 Tax=Limnoglobus roseus TaxID=2598579 RepID=A0A5C1ANT7_9BACT|nr:hypothetical protein [Limnoglobus roseus]QEL18528.1 phage tail tape measure protein [Limnoglobus roseus]